MLRHVVLFRWLPDAKPEDVAALESGLRRMPDLVPEIRRYEMGPDVGLIDGAYDFALVAEFDDEEGYRAYADHRDHRELVTELVGPILDRMARVQYEV